MVRIIPRPDLAHVELVEDHAEELDVELGVLVAGLLDGLARGLSAQRDQDDAVALAAQQGRKVLAIDCDLRRPRLHKVFRLKNTAGLTSCLVGRSSLDEIIHECPGEANLHLIPSGPVPPNPAELLTSKAMKELLARLEKSYDHVFIDTPPLMAGSDAILLGGQGDGIILVTLAGKTPRKTIEKARDEIAKFNIKLFGVILNKLNMRKAGAGYYSYHYKYGADTDQDESRI